MLLWLIQIEGIFLCHLCFAQNYITNPGFEGPDGIEVIPEDWFAGCGVMNTPDTQPGWWNIENKPKEGNAYINLLYKEDGTTESVYQKLATPLTAGGCYHIQIYLAMACQDSISNLFEYDLNHPGDLIIRGSTSYGCNNGQILGSFKQVSNCQWRLYEAIFHADSTINYVYLEFSKGASLHKNGSIIIDDFMLQDLMPFETETVEPIYATNQFLKSKENGTNYVWQIDGNLLSEDTCCIFVTADGNHFIELTYIVDDTCLVTERFNLWVKPLIPNILTISDNDPINNTFFIYGLTENATLTIINRWGQTVFQENNYQNSWSPSNMIQGVYFYRLDLWDTGRIFTGCFYVQ